jgi:hypothetical protein
MALDMLVISISYAVRLTRRDGSIGDRVGSIVADE